MADYKFKNIPDPERCSVGQALMWWKSRQQPVSLLIEQKLNRSDRWYLSKWNLSDVDAFFELCAGRVAFWAKPAQNITSIALRDETANVDIDLRLTGYQVNHGSNVAVHVAFDGLGEFEKIPPNRLNKAMLFPGGLVNTVPVWHPDMIKEYPSELWAYFFVEVDFKELVALFPPELDAAPAQTRPAPAQESEFVAWARAEKEKHGRWPPTRKAKHGQIGCREWAAEQGIAREAVEGWAKDHGFVNERGAPEKCDKQSGQ